jgi:hypothetical protein
VILLLLSFNHLIDIDIGQPVVSAAMDYLGAYIFALSVAASLQRTVSHQQSTKQSLLDKK